MHYGYHMNREESESLVSYVTISLLLAAAFILKLLLLLSRCPGEQSKKKYRSHPTILAILPPSLISMFRPLALLVDEYSLINIVNSNDPSTGRTAARHSSLSFPLISWGQTHCICHFLWVHVDADISKLFLLLSAFLPVFSLFFFVPPRFSLSCLIPILSHLIVPSLGKKNNNFSSSFFGGVQLSMQGGVGLKEHGN